MRLSRALDVLVYAATASLTVAAGALAFHKIAPTRLDEAWVLRLLALAVALLVVPLVVAAARRLPPRAGSVALDRSHGLSDRLTSALEFARLPPGERTPLVEMAIDDAVAHAKSLSPRRAHPLRPPVELVAVIPAIAALIGVVWLEVPVKRVIPRQPSIDALVVAPDDIELFREMAKELAREDQSPEVKAAVDRFNQLIEDLANRRLERTEAFRRLESLERDLLKGQEADAAALKEQLAETGKQLRDSELAEKLAEALQKGDPKAARKEMKALAERLRTEKKPDEAAIERLRKALEKASKRREEARKALEQRRAEMQEQLLKKKKQVEDEKDPKKKREEERLLRKKERELERLDRERERQQRASSELERLDRELAQAAADLMKDLGLTEEDLRKAAEDLDRAAEDLNRLDEQEMSQKEKEELRKRIEELREVLRQQGQGGQQRMARMVRFGKRARGGSGGEGQEPGEGEQPGKGKPGQGQGEPGEGEGEGQGQGKGQRGKGGPSPGGGGDPVLVLGPGGAPIPMPGAGSGEQGGGKEPGGEGQGKGDGAGKGSGGPIAGSATDPSMGTQDVEAQGLDTGQGPSNSQVILSAAERGFQGEAYEKVFTQYRTVAEENIAKETIPDGYRFYVQRYFQLIRPRE